MVTMSKPSNFTGVKDMYIWNKQAGYPCWDVLHECSVGNLTKGTKDTEDDAVTHETGVTTSTWNRKLVTGDSKDFNITKLNARKNKEAQIQNLVLSSALPSGIVRLMFDFC